MLAITEIHLSAHDTALVFFALSMALAEADDPASKTALRKLSRTFAVAVRDCQTIGGAAQVVIEILNEAGKGGTDETKRSG